MALYPDQLDDFVNLTLARFRRGTWNDISLPFQEYIFPSRIIQSKRLKEKGGESLKWKVQVRNTGTARHTGLFDTNQTSVKDLTVGASAGWTFQTVNWSYDVREDDFQGDDMTRIVREIEIREHSMWNDFFQLMEVALWSAPSSSSQNPRVPSGIPFWLQKASTPTPSFQGGNPSGFTDGAGGISSTTYTTWKNWAGNYTDINRPDLISKMREAMYKTKFVAPKKYSETTNGSSAFEHFTTYRVVSPLEALLENRNENLGTDLAKYEGSVIYRSTPITPVPYLDENDSTDPIYGVNFNYFTYFVKSGWDMKLMPVKESPHQRNVRERHMDHSGNFAAIDRRQAGYVLSKAA